MKFQFFLCLCFFFHLSNEKFNYFRVNMYTMHVKIYNDKEIDRRKESFQQISYVRFTSIRLQCTYKRLHFVVVAVAGREIYNSKCANCFVIDMIWSSNMNCVCLIGKIFPQNRSISLLFQQNQRKIKPKN